MKSIFAIIAALLVSINCHAGFSTGPNLSSNSLLYTSPLITPGGLVVIGDSLSVQFVTNLAGFGPVATNGGLHCGGTTNVLTAGKGWFTNGMTLITGEATTWTNQSWAICLTNYFKQITGWTIPLDTALAVSGAPIANYGDMDTSDCYFAGYQDLANGSATYGATGTNSFSVDQGMSHRFVFWGTNDYGTTNDYYVIVSGVNYTNPTPGVTYTTNIFVAGTYGSFTTCYAVGAPNTLRSVRRYNNRMGGNWGAKGTSRQYYPPTYANTAANDPLVYVTNLSPQVTGVPKILMIAGSQNDRLICTAYGRGTNTSPSGVYTNGWLAYARQLTNISTIARNLGYTVIGADIPYSPNTASDTVSLNLAFTNAWVLNSFDYFYRWNASNSVYQATSGYFTDNTHPTAQLANIWATNQANAFGLKRTAIIK